MGTNYYWHQPKCPHCGVGAEPKHIGKRFAAGTKTGTAFYLHIYPDDDIRTPQDWYVLIDAAGTEVRNEYGRLVTRAEMRSIIGKNWIAKKGDFC